MAENGLDGTADGVAGSVAGGMAARRAGRSKDVDSSGCRWVGGGKMRSKNS